MMSLRREPSSPSLRRIRTVSALLAVLLAAALLTVVPAAPASADDLNDWLTTINTFRAANGRGPLEYDAELSSLALQQSNVIARNGQLSHTANLAAGVTSNWTKLGENVGTGSSTAIIWEAFLGSAPHRGNLLDPSFTRIGIGVVWIGGTQWVTHRFAAVGASAPAPAPAPQPEPEPEPVYVPPPPTTAPRVTAPPVVVPVTVPPTIPTTTTTAPPPEPVVVPAASAPDRAAALLDALYRIER